MRFDRGNRRHGIKQPRDLASRVDTHVTAIRIDHTSLVMIAHDGDDCVIGEPCLDGYYRAELLRAKTVRFGTWLMFEL